MSINSIEKNIDAIHRAQADGTVTNRFETSVLFALILHLATLRGAMSPDAEGVI